MDWTLAIKRNREALLGVLAMLFASAGFAPGGAAPTLSRQVYFAVLRVLRPAESAVRRLLVLAEREVTVAPPAMRGPPAHPIPHGSAERAPAFALFDVRKRFDAPARRRFAVAPRLSFLGYDDPVFDDAPGSSSDQPVNAVRLCQRLQALRAVLDDLPRHARRLARARARLRAKFKSGPRAIRSPLRPGWPPGHRRRALHPVDEILRHCASNAGGSIPEILAYRQHDTQAPTLPTRDVQAEQIGYV